MLSSLDVERLHEVMAEAKEAILLAKTALKDKKISSEEQLEDVESNNNVVHICPKSIVDFNTLQNKKLQLVPHIADLLSKTSEDLCCVVVLNRKHLRNRAVQKHIEELLTITVMVAKVLGEETGRYLLATSHKPEST